LPTVVQVATKQRKNFVIDRESIFL